LFDCMSVDVIGKVPPFPGIRKGGQGDRFVEGEGPGYSQIIRILQIQPGFSSHVLIIPPACHDGQI